VYIKVHVSADAKREELIRESSDHYRISVKEPAQRNVANVRVAELLSREFNVARGSVRLISGHHSPSKIFSIPDM